MGLFGGSSKSGSAQGTAGSQTQLGNPVSVNISSGDDQNARVYYTNQTTQTDYGAISGALEFANALAGRDNNLSKLELQSAERLATKFAGNGENLARFFVSTSERVSNSLIDQVGDQNRLLSGAVSNLTAGFQEFVNRENNPGERVNLYLIVGAAGVALAFLLRGKK